MKLGVNRFGRSPENDFQIEHPTISARHCEIVAGNNEIILSDCDSTNGTFVAGQPIKEAGHRIVQLYKAWDRPEQADAWRKKVQ